MFANQQAINAQQSAMWTNLNQTMHNQRMGDIAAAGAANTAIHQQRVAMGEASTAAFLDRLNSPVAQRHRSARADPQHSWINMIREEETVRTASGEDVQVDAGADRYFVDERNRRWVGATGSVDANDFRAAGLNPDDYQEGQIRRHAAALVPSVPADRRGRVPSVTAGRACRWPFRVEDRRGSADGSVSVLGIGRIG